jgi:hypothetical protein
MELFKIPPFDQNLNLSGSSSLLCDSTKTLAQLKVLPRSLIYLRADTEIVNGLGSASASAKVNGSARGDEAWIMSQHPEEGFKGGERCLIGTQVDDATAVPYKRST